jgi:hypothetical protein
MAGAKEVMTVKVGALTEVVASTRQLYGHPQGPWIMQPAVARTAGPGLQGHRSRWRARQRNRFAVEVKDDVPTLSDDAELAINLAKLQTNLMIVLDLSGSMNCGTAQQRPNDPNNRLNLAKKALWIDQQV